MARAWEELGAKVNSEWKKSKPDSVTVKGIEVVSVDCTKPENKPVCSRYEIKGFPTIKAVWKEREWPFEGGNRSFELLLKWATEVGSTDAWAARAKKAKGNKEEL